MTKPHMTALWLRKKFISVLM